MKYLSTCQQFPQYTYLSVNYPINNYPIVPSILDLIKMKCDYCNKDFGDVLKHLKKSELCQTVYDMESLVNERKLIRLQKKRDCQKILYEKKRERILKQKKEYYQDNKDEIISKRQDHYKENKDEILSKRQDHYKENRVEILQKKKEYYQKFKHLIYQRHRFRNYIAKEEILSYRSQAQEHLYHHTNGFCQPQTMSYLNHSVDFYDGICDSCSEASAIEIIGLNRTVCLRCSKHTVTSAKLK